MGFFNCCCGASSPPSCSRAVWPTSLSMVTDGKTVTLTLLGAGSYITTPNESSTTFDSHDITCSPVTGVVVYNLGCVANEWRVTYTVGLRSCGGNTVYSDAPGFLGRTCEGVIDYSSYVDSPIHIEGTWMTTWAKLPGDPDPPISGSFVIG